MSNVIIKERSYFIKGFYIFKKIYWKLLSYKLKKTKNDQSPIIYLHPFFKIKLRINLKKDVDRGIYFGTFEFENTFLFFDLIKKGDIIVDIGANIGFYSLLAASKLQDGGKVYSFEPSKFIINELKSNIEINNYKNIEVFDFALSDSSGKKDFYRCEDDAYNSLLAKPMQKVVSIDSVDVITLDDFIMMNNISKIDVIKIDAEGLDYEILKGAQQTIMNFKPIIFCEYNSYYLNDKSKAEFIDYLERSGYELRFIKKNRFSFSIENFNQNTTSASEIICIPKYK